MIPLEDNFSDIISKAQRGLGLSDSELAEKAGLDRVAFLRLREGEFDETAMSRVAPLLELNGRALGELARGEYRPDVVDTEGLAMFTTSYGDMQVNAYLVWDPGSSAAAIFDTGADCSSILSRASKDNLAVELILLTHTHPDHVADLAKMVKATGARVFVSERESAAGAQPAKERDSWKVGALKIEALLTWGHSRGGMTYFVTGLKRPIAVVGDSIFAGSIGGGNISYQEALRNNREKILTLPEDTIICPGHGPLTTVGGEKEHNPFFA